MEELIRASNARRGAWRALLRGYDNKCVTSRKLCACERSRSRRGFGANAPVATARAGWPAAASCEAGARLPPILSPAGGRDERLARPACASSASFPARTRCLNPSRAGGRDERPRVRCAWIAEFGLQNPANLSRRVAGIGAHSGPDALSRYFGSYCFNSCGHDFTTSPTSFVNAFFSVSFLTSSAESRLPHDVERVPCDSVAS